MDRALCILIRLFILLAGFSKPLSEFGMGTYEEWSPGKKIKLLMVGYNGARNTGADARVVAAVEQLKELFGADNVEISVMTLNEEVLEGYFDEDVRLLKISSIFPKDLYLACSSHHAAILCEGSTLKSTFANALSLFFCEASGVMGRQGKPCIAFGSEVGHMEPFLKRFAAKTCKGTYFITRTSESQEVLDEIGLEGHVGTDTAWLYHDEIDEHEARRLLLEQGWDGEKPLLGVAAIDPFCWPVRASLRKWACGLLTKNRESQYDKWYFYSDSPQRRAAYKRYVDELAKAVRGACQEMGFFPVLLGMERMDAKACAALRERLGTPCAEFLSGECSADIMVGVLQRLSALVTSRYHAAVLSAKGGCPMVAVSMDERLDSLMREFGLDGHYLHHVTDEGLGDAVLASLSRGHRERDQLRRHIQGKLPSYKARQEEMGVFVRDYILERLGRGVSGKRCAGKGAR